MLKTGTVFQFIVFIATFVITVFYLRNAIKGKVEPLRELPAVAAISDAVDRAVEEGGSVLVTPGDVAYLSGMFVPQTVAGLNVLRHTVKLCVRKGARYIAASAMNAETFPLMDGIVRESCVAEGKPEAYKAEDVVYPGLNTTEWMTNMYSLIQTESVSAFVILGPTTGSGCNRPWGAARERGATVIGGTARFLHNTSYVLYADYPLYSDEIFAASAFASGDPVVTSGLVAGDIMKWAMIALILIGVIATIAGAPFESWLKG